jgi:GTPase SAR1 family protein
METLKIMVCGLENVGKSSILYTLERKYSLLGGLSPTKGIERSTFKIFGYQVTAWDLGGQETYRQGYLKKQVFFEDTDLFIYCVEVINNKTFELALDYYKGILEIFQNDVKHIPPILILLHKVDPDVRDNPEIRQNVDLIMKMFQNASNDTPIEFFETSIYDEWTLTNAFSYGLRKLSTKTEVLSRQLADFSTKILTNAIILLNKNGYLIAEYASNEQSAFSCQSVSTQSMYMYLLMKERNIQPLKITVDLKDEFIVFREVLIETESFFMIFSSKVSRSLELFNEYFPKFAEQTKDVFKFFFT